MLKIFVASDHAGFDLKNQIIEYLIAKSFSIVDYGCYSSDSADYPDYAHPLAYDLESTDNAIGIVFCGSGNGINMTVNKHAGIRSAICWNVEIARLAKSHNNANICSLPARFVGVLEAINIIEIFLNTDFEGGRHLDRITKIPCK